MKNLTLKKYFLLLFTLSLISFPFSTEAYNSPGRDGAGLQCLWGPGCLVETNPATAELSSFRQSAYNECISRSRPADFCNTAADSAQSAASTYNNCVLGSGSASTCETAANAVVNVSQPLPPLPAPTQTSPTGCITSDERPTVVAPVNGVCPAGSASVVNGRERPTLVSPTGCVTNDEQPVAVAPVNGLCPPNSRSVIDGREVSSNITYVPLEPIPGLTPSANINFGDLLETIFKVLIILVGMIAVGAFVYAGITYMTSDVVGSKMDAIKRLNASLLGLLLLVSSWLILYTINPQLVRFSGVLNPSTSYAPVVPQQTGICMGQSCLSPAQQAAIRDLQQNGGLRVPDSVAQEAQNAAAAQAQACTSSGGRTVLGVAFRGGCTSPSVVQYLERNNLSRCSDIVGVQGHTGLCVK